MEYLISFLLGYLLGSIPFAYLYAKWIKGVDISTTGSGNIGTLNSYEVTQSKLVGILVLFFDVLKGAASAYLIILIFPGDFTYPALAVIFAVFSHCFNPWLKFKGGRGLATAAGGTLVILPFLLFIWLLIWAIIFAMKKNIHFANIWATIMTLIITLTSSDIAVKYVFYPVYSEGAAVLFTAAALIIIMIKHIEPLKELLNNREEIFKKGKQDE